MTFENNRTTLLCYFKLCASLRSHQPIKTGATVRKRPLLVKIRDFMSHVTIEFSGWHWKTLCIISQPSVNSNLGYSPEAHNLGQHWRVSVPCDLAIWRITLKNYGVPLLHHFKLCVHHFVTICKLKLELWSGNIQNRAKFVLTLVALTFDVWPWPFFCMDITFVSGNNSCKFRDNTMMETATKV